MAIGVLRQGPRLAGMADLGAASVVAEMTVDGLEAVAGGAPYRDFTIRRKQRVKVVFEIGQQKRADPGRLEQPHVSGLPAGKVDMRVQRDARAAQHVIHVGTPDLALETAMQRRRGGEGLYIFPQLWILGLGNPQKQSEPLL